MILEFWLKQTGLLDRDDEPELLVARLQKETGQTSTTTDQRFSRFCPMPFSIR
jgi:hypothetical protein